MKRFWLVLLSAAVFLVSAEFLAVWVVRSDLIPCNRPDYELNFRPQPFWADVDSNFGVWHTLPRFHHKMECFDVEYHINSYGARDKERTLQSDKPRFAVIGDSFMEGWGTPDGSRLSDRLEQLTGEEFLNFGTAGDFGSTQYYLLYKSLAKKFDHTAVLVGILPDNDFIDDDFEIGKELHDERYRPYWVGGYPDYQLRYFVSTLEDAKYSMIYFNKQNRGWKVYLAEWLRSLSYTYNVVEYTRKLAKYKEAISALKKERQEKTHDTYAGYYDFNADQYNRLIYSIGKIKAESEGRRMIILLIPTPNDFLRAKNEPSPLSTRLQELGPTVGFELIDLLTEIQAATNDPDTLYFSCDKHWSPKGHQLAAQIVYNYLQNHR